MQGIFVRVCFVSLPALLDFSASPSLQSDLAPLLTIKFGPLKSAFRLNLRSWSPPLRFLAHFVHGPPNFLTMQIWPPKVGPPALSSIVASTQGRCTSIDGCDMGVVWHGGHGERHASSVSQGLWTRSRRLLFVQLRTLRNDPVPPLPKTLSIAPQNS